MIPAQLSNSTASTARGRMTPVFPELLIPDVQDEVGILFVQRPAHEAAGSTSICAVTPIRCWR